MLLEFARLLGLSGDTSFAFGPAKEAIIFIVCGLILALVGYKIKGVLGSIVALVLGGIALLYMKGYF
ncbi:MAG: hypothetical protein JRF69_08485 [Deltaproteobacteria bacterium]|nr:hypothetical protein [Deltaproteobacteria bacterium]